jgi:hypothetical protein
MAARDPTLHEFAVLTASEEAATTFAQQRGLLLSANALAQRQQQQNNQQQCLLGTAGCGGVVTLARKYRPDRAKSYEGFRCSQCRRFRSAKNAVIAGEIRGAAPNQQEFRSFFATVSANAVSHTKLSIQIALSVIYLWSKGLSMAETKRT